MSDIEVRRIKGQIGRTQKVCSDCENTLYETVVVDTCCCTFCLCLNTSPGICVITTQECELSNCTTLERGLVVRSSPGEAVGVGTTSVPLSKFCSELKNKKEEKHTQVLGVYSSQFSAIVTEDLRKSTWRRKG